MASKSTELYFEPISQGMCDAVGCSNPAKYRVSWAHGMFVRLVCAIHREEVVELPKEANVSTIFGIRAIRQGL